MITVIITTYRRPVLLKKAIQSVLDQTYPHFQICVYDNASGDETAEVVRQLMSEDPRIKYHCHPYNIGMMANYAYALSHIETPFFNLLSDDDHLLPHFFETALQGFEKFPEVAFSACGVQAVNEEGQCVSAPHAEWLKEGYFHPLEGLVEMISKPLLPNGMLFQYRFVKCVMPDLSRELQIRWDTDYLLQIISQFPFFITKEVCAIFLSHKEGHSTGNYMQMLESAKKFEDHIIATHKMMSRLLVNPAIPLDLKKVVRKTFSSKLNRDFYNNIKSFAQRKMFFEVWHATKLYFTRRHDFHQ